MREFIVVCTASLWVTTKGSALHFLTGEFLEAVAFNNNGDRLGRPDYPKPRKAECISSLRLVI